MKRVMIWVSEHKGVGRGAVVVLLLLAIIGPWFYTLDGVPPPEWCKAPLFLLKNGRCAGLVSGTFVIALVSGAFININWELVTGTTVLPARARELFGVYLFMLYVILIILPLCTTAVLAWLKGSRRWQRFHLAACGSATIMSCLPTLLEPELRSGRFWGMWLYIGVLISVLALDIFSPCQHQPSAT